MARRHKVYYAKWVRMKFSKMFCTDSLLLQSMSAVNPPLTEKKLIHMTTETQVIYVVCCKTLSFPSAPQKNPNT